MPGSEEKVSSNFLVLDEFQNTCTLWGMASGVLLTVT